MTKYLRFSLIILLISTFSFGQSNEEIDRLIDSLSWDSFHLSKSSQTFFATFNPNANELIKIGKPASEKLFRSINKPDKTVIIHLILTKLYEPENNYLYPHLINYYCEYKKHIGLHFILNGLVWDWLEKTSDYSIQKSQVEKIKLYWDKKLHDSQNVFSINPEDLFSEIQKRDSSEFACTDNKKYINNSNLLDFKDIHNIWFIKYPNPQFEKVFTILGNDSLCWHYSDNSFSVIYVADGIQFEFDRDQTLRKIYIKANYQGKLLNDLLMIDNRDRVKSKLGNPLEHKAPRYEYDWDYEKFGINIAFGDANRIIDLQLKRPLDRPQK
jgi:hypothetical protein